MFKRILIANRGAIATRIIRTLKKLNIEAIAIYHQQDQASLHVQHADIAVCLGDGTAADTYLNIDKIINIAKAEGAEAIHPGYGFLSENTKFVAACEAAGIAFIGPTVEQMNIFGLKHLARDAAEKAQVPLVPGSPVLATQTHATQWAADVGYPVMLKSSAGGGGIGMQVCRDEAELNSAWHSVKRLSTNYFSDDTVFLEKYIENARHIEVQIFGDGKGSAIALGERDCSAQRRNQKVIEECPAPNLHDDVRQQMLQTAEALMASVQYRNAGTVEYIYDADSQQFYFLEVNTRLQVEHGVTEEVWQVDLVDWMVRLAANELPDLGNLKTDLQPRGHAIQVRVYAEDPSQDFRPSAGLLSLVDFPYGDGIRIDHWIEAGITVPALFDPMLAKVIVHAHDRASALTKITTTLDNSAIYGIETNMRYVAGVLQTNAAQQASMLTRTLAEFQFQSPCIRVLNAGTQTTIQDYPGRVGYWHVGVPPSGPMDNVSFQLANKIVGNTQDSAGIEITLNGPDLEFTAPTVIALTGAALQATVNQKPIAMNEPVFIQTGDVLQCGKLKGSGARAYLAIAGGIQCPDYLGSKSTFTLGQFGGHVGRALRTGDVLPIQLVTNQTPITQTVTPAEITDHVTLRVIYGPHGAPEFFTEQDIVQFFNHEWEVHYNSSRTGIRLIGPKPEWARQSGGEAGLHPSNIHDNAYAFGTVDFTGDMPVILGPDGPSLGGFVCPATVISADLWKLGQLKAGCKIRFLPVNYNQAKAFAKQQQQAISELNLGHDTADIWPLERESDLMSPIVHRTQWGDDTIHCRLAGDHFLLVEMGPLVLDVARRFKIHALMLALETRKPEGVFELTPGVRSLQIHYNSLIVELSDLLSLIDTVLHELTQTDAELSVPSRIVHLPLSWDDEACQLAIEKYMQSVRKDAPWCPSNLEFIRRINGLPDLQAVKDIVFEASYLVLGLGDVYLGAPLATPLNPQHRLVTTKYNPARTWTAENSVGIGGAYLCVYGMEGPGGYQFVGRTSQMWNRYHTTEDFQQPWLLRFFDQIRFYEVSAQELQEIRQNLPLGKHKLNIEETQFSLADYQALLDKNTVDDTVFTKKREQAFAAELQHWKDTGQLTFEPMESTADAKTEREMPENCIGISSPVSGSVWQLSANIGEQVTKGQVLMVLESMKMEIEVHAPEDGVLIERPLQAGQAVHAGQSLAWLEPSR